jgi:DNA-binding beta-propeller fold protein YncE
VGGPPIRVKFTPDGKRALVSDPQAGQLIVIDAATRKELKRLDLGQGAVGILIAPDGRRAYVATSATGKVHAVNLEDLSVAGSVETGKGPDGLGWAGK